MRKRIGTFDVKAVPRARVLRPTYDIEITKGKTYFLSAYRNVSGAYVKVLQVFLNTDRQDNPSVSAKVEVIVKVGSHPSKFYDVGHVTTVQSIHLYEKREDASKS